MIYKEEGGNFCLPLLISFIKFSSFQLQIPIEIILSYNVSARLL